MVHPVNWKALFSGK